MGAVTPMWKREGWVPALEFVEWPRLTEHREEHERLLLALRQPQAPRLRRRFEKEDEDFLESERAALGHGGEPKQVEVTPPARRQAMLEEADRSDGDAMRALCAHVGRIAEEVFVYEHEWRAALAAARLEAGCQPESQDANDDPLLDAESAYFFGGPDTANELAASELADRQMHAARYLQERRALGADIEALGVFKGVALSARGANVLAEIEQACPGVTGGKSELAMLSAHVGGVMA